MGRVWVMLAVLGASSVAHGAPCAPVVRGLQLSADWQRAVDALNDELATRPDVERCVEVIVRADGARATIVVTLADRQATRNVATPADLRATLLALVLATIPPLANPVAPTAAAHDLPGDEPPRDPSTIPIISPPSRAQTVDSTLDGTSLRTRAIERDERAIRSGIDVGLAIGMLWIDHDAQTSAAALLRWTHGDWSIDLDGRFTMPPMSIRATPSATGAMPFASPAYVLRSREIGVEAGRRFDLGSIAFTASGGLSFVSIEQFRLDDAEWRSGGVVRLGARLRAETSSSRRLGLFAIIDVSRDADQLHSSGDTMIAAPQLPTWSAGIALGGDVRAWP